MPVQLTSPQAILGLQATSSHQWDKPAKYIHPALYSVRQWETTAQLIITDSDPDMI